MGTKSSSKTSSQTIYGNTTTSNPYAYSKTDNNGTISGFTDGTALKSVYEMVNKSIDSLLNEYINPSMNSPVNQSKISSFSDTLSQQTRKNLENDIINPLSNRNMIRSSQAADLYKSLLNQNISSMADYTKELLSDSQDDTGKMLSKLLSMYMLGAGYLSDMQNHSLKASTGNASTYNTTTSSSSGVNDITSTLLPLAITAAAAFL